MLSPEVEKRLQAAQQNEKNYQPNGEIAAKLAEKTLVMFVGPVAVGKSFLMNHVAEVAGDFSRVPVFTTRQPREDDEPGMFRYLPHDDAHVSELLGKIENREVVQYAIHPTSGHIYGSEISDHANAYNMLAMLSGGVEQLRHIPFKDTVIIGVAVPPPTWQRRLAARYPQPSEEKTKRLKEAVLSLEWLLSHDDVRWVTNAGDIAATAQETIGIVKYNQQPATGGAQHARQLLEYIRKSAR